MSEQIRCPDCGYSRPASSEDMPAFHKPGCKARRWLKKLHLGNWVEPKTANIRGVICKLDEAGLVLAAISPEGQRWKSS